MRYLEENICLIGAIPGPGKPSLEQINHFVALVVDDLLEFWDPGVYFSRTALYPAGRFSLGAIIPLVCDLLGARQMAGFPFPGAILFCSVCYLRSVDIENFDENTWPSRTIEKHRATAETWRQAENEAERAKIFKTSGVRYSELNRLPYYDVIRHTVVDTVHAHYLVILNNHFSDVWGMDSEQLDGNGSLPFTFKPPICSDKQNPSKMANGVLDDQGELIQEHNRTAVLGANTLAEIWKDQEELLLPSSIAPGPTKFGSKKTKLKADQWRVVGTIHLVVTLIRLWGHGSGRKRAMLNNFMHLVTAVQLARMHTTSEANIALYQFHFKEYLKGFVELYKDASIHPTHHMGLHISSFLKDFGPSHSVRTFAFERMNLTLQNIPTNMKSGEQKRYH
ncbi:hypothetical protein BKA93DRAFT_819200 [Sparassis latifolia]